MRPAEVGRHQVRVVQVFQRRARVDGASVEDGLHTGTLGTIVVDSPHDAVSFTHCARAARRQFCHRLLGRGQCTGAKCPYRPQMRTPTRV